MDLASAIIGAVVIIICVLPFIFISRNRKKREKQMLQSLTEIASQHNCKVTQHELSVDFAIGLDEINNYIFFIKKANETAQFINLGDIQTCRVMTTDSSGENSNEDNYNFSERIDLSFIPKAKNKPAINLEFYNTGKSNQLIAREERQMVEKWAKLINDRLKNK